MEFSRRDFLGAGSALAAAGLMSAAGQASAQTAKVPAKWDETVDFLIVGTGFAGLAAALEAHQIGIKNVLVIDKMPTPGGNSIINGGAVAAAGTDMQKKAGISDNPDLLYSDILLMNPLRTSTGSVTRSAFSLKPLRIMAATP